MKKTMSKNYKLYIASVSLPIEVKPRIYAVIADEIVKDEVIAIAVREQYHLCDGDIPNPKVKKFIYDLVDNKIIDGGGERFYIVRALKEDRIPLDTKFQMVRANTAFEAMQASSKALWLRKDKILRWEAKEATLVENLFDIIHLGPISEN